MDALLSFTAENFGPYRNSATVSLLSTRLSEPDVARHLQWGHGARTVGVLPAAGIFGANASGKSAILRAMAHMRMLVVGSFRRGSASSPIPRRPFLLDRESGRHPTRFEIDLVLDGVRWQYGFEIDDRRVLGEYALHYPNGRQAAVFDRDGDAITFGKPFRTDGRVLQRLVRPNGLLVSVAGAAADSDLTPLFEWFEANLLLAESENRDWRAVRTAALVQSPDSRDRVMRLLRAADLGIADISRNPVPEELRERLARVLSGGDENDEDRESIHLFIADELRLTHMGDGVSPELGSEDESLGTMVWVGLVGPVLDALDGGHVLLADELDASLHPHLVAELIRLFQSPDTNPRCAQIVFNAHDVTLLGDSEHRTLGRDQVWFSEKDHMGVARLSSLSDFGPRKDEALERRYLQGRFGALPVLDPSGFAHAALVDS